MECAALVDVCRVAGFLAPPEAEEAKILLPRIVAMLSRMCRAWESRIGARTRTGDAHEDARWGTKEGRRGAKEERSTTRGVCRSPSTGDARFFAGSAVQLEIARVMVG